MSGALLATMALALALACPPGASAAPNVLFAGPRPAGPQANLRCSREGSRIAWTGAIGAEGWFIESRSGLTVLDPDTGLTVRLSSEQGEFCWANGGNALVQLLRLGPGEGARFFLIDADSGATEPLLTVTDDPVECSFSPDCQKVAYMLDDQLYVSDLSKDARPRSLRYEGDTPDFAIWLGNNELLIYAGDRLCTLDLSSDACRPVGGFTDAQHPLLGQKRYVGAARSGRLIAVVLGDEASSSVSLVVLRRETDRWTPATVAKQEGGLIAFPLFSPDEKGIAYVACADDGNGPDRLFVASLSGSGAKMLSGDYQNIWGPRGFDWSADGQSIVYVTLRNTVETVSVD